MTFTAAHISPLVALVAGILILIMPRLLNYIVALYLILVGSWASTPSTTSSADAEPSVRAQIIRLASPSATVICKGPGAIRTVVPW